ncbi:hypothetical protein [Pseudomonas sp. RIT-PI-AD]|uniref:hypothetical protein n=1 Tax=Pseudomonas sp. RIT-PI-AD TaxID=3035294 RepID=UPI0021D83A6C|nr:hypothetical protein [Pseudomonas sp. RIT-PI-AD]
MPEQQHIFAGYGAPTSAPEFVGAHYCDSQNGDVYLAADVGEEGTRWVRVVTVTEGNGPPGFGSGPVMYRDIDSGTVYLRFGSTWHPVGG